MCGPASGGRVTEEPKDILVLLQGFEPRTVCPASGGQVTEEPKDILVLLQGFEPRTV